jgi:hypothetical protein
VRVTTSSGMPGAVTGVVVVVVMAQASVPSVP